MKFKSREWIMALPREDQMKLHSRNKDIQERADSVCAEWGTRAPAPVDGEDPRKYERDLAIRFKKKLPPRKDCIYPDHATKTSTLNDLRRMDLYELDEPAFKVMEPDYYHASKIAASRNDTVPDGELEARTVVDPQNGMKVVKFFG